MLPKNRRISKDEFKVLAIYHGYKKIFHSPLVSIVIYPESTQKEQLASGLSKFSFSVSKKVSKKAVIRNKLRRWGYTSVQKVIDSIPKGLYISFSFKKGADTSTHTQIESEIQGLIQKI